MSAWLNVLTGISQGTFDTIYIRDASGNIVNILTLLGGGGSGGIVASVASPLAINSGVLSLNLGGFATAATTPLSLLNGQLSIDLTPYVLTTTLGSYSTTVQLNAAIATALVSYVTSSALTTLLSGKISTTHEASNVGAANVAFGAFDVNTQTVTLQNSAGVTAVLSVDNGGYLNANGNGIIDVATLNGWEFLNQSYKDSSGTVRDLVPSLTGTLTYNGSTLTDLTYLSSNFTTTAALTTLLAGKEDTITDLTCDDIMAGCVTNYQYASVAARLNVVADSTRPSACHFINEQAGSQTLTIWNKATGSNVYLTEFVNGLSRTVVGSVTTNGTSCSFNTSSDARLKNITDDEARGLQTILALKPRTWTWISSGEEDEGLVAQEVLQVFPAAVKGSEDRQYMLDYSRFVPILIKAIQEQQVMIQALQTQMETKMMT